MIALVDHKVSYIITNVDWDFSLSSSPIPLLLQQRTRKVYIPHDLKAHTRVWIHSSNGECTPKMCYDFKRPCVILLGWWRCIGSKAIPPSKSCMVWKLIHNTIPSNDQWKRRGFTLPSRCDLCNEDEETSHHLFFHCKYASWLWAWVGSMFWFHDSIHCWEDVKKIFSKKASGQCRVLHYATVISVFNAIWQARNKVRFQNIGFIFSYSISCILDVVSIDGNNADESYLDMQDFMILKSFHISIRPPKAP
ncbi:uncharacterized protein LOC131650043 [Vicia villosa]|uniref:uncharacterized protein LOC131650043 n=1 Tax=Vicia villosa TaxID=3911 RepID=UPI00273B8515|nr:uncharacterized protein LOC131650043 [Vicia villosa]